MRIYVFSSLLFSCALVSAQQTTFEKCGTMQLLQQHIIQDPLLPDAIKKNDERARKWLSSQTIHKSKLIFTIPVVVHVIYNQDSLLQNIPDSVILSQIDILNEDYRRLNADTINLRAIFDSIAADIGIEFCLAKRDSAGNPTTGITRTVTNKQSFDLFNGMDSMKFTATGGKDAWPRDKYLNIWVCYMTFFGSEGTLGYAQFPGDKASTDGVVILYKYFGRTGYPGTVAGSKGRTTTHEVGHWLGLRHIWADDCDWFTGVCQCDSSDFVDDTPNQAGQSNFDCVKDTNTCSNEASYWGSTNPPDMVENYMDYSSDTCMNTFTAGQRDRMLSFLNTSRISLLSSDGCVPPVSVGRSMTGFEDDVKVYPLPSSRYINVMLTKPMGNVTLTIINLFGQEVQKYRSEALFPKTFIFDLKDVPAGVYFIKVTGDETIIVKKLIIY